MLRGLAELFNRSKRRGPVPPVGLRNFFQLYAPILDAWVIFDSSGDTPDMVAMAVADLRIPLKRDLLARIQREAGEP